MVDIVRSDSDEGAGKIQKGFPKSLRIGRPCSMVVRQGMMAMLEQPTYLLGSGGVDQAKLGDAAAKPGAMHSGFHIRKLLDPIPCL